MAARQRENWQFKNRRERRNRRQNLVSNRSFISVVDQRFLKIAHSLMGKKLLKKQTQILKTSKILILNLTEVFFFNLKLIAVRFVLFFLTYVPLQSHNNLKISFQGKIFLAFKLFLYILWQKKFSSKIKFLIIFLYLCYNFILFFKMS